MRPTPPSPSNNDTPPTDQRNGGGGSSNSNDGRHPNASNFRPPPSNGNTTTTVATITPRPPLSNTVATVEPSDDRNNAMDETDESGNQYPREYPSESSNNTLLTPSDLLNRLLNQGAVAPLGGQRENGNGTNRNGGGDGDTANGNANLPPPTDILPTTESTFHHNISAGNTTALTSASLVGSLERRFSTPMNLDDGGGRTPSTGLTSSTERWERVR